ncbi:MAG: M2 family metallopeptidase [Deltaproteobacteria bacterium]|nr:M2 family metallopeptidase [Deltaproteobacteria bacterium]
MVGRSGANARLERMFMALLMLAANVGGGCGKREEVPCRCPDATPPAAPSIGASVEHASGAGVSAHEPTEAEARRWLDEDYVPAVRRLERAASLMSWNAYVSGNQDFYRAKEDADILYRRFHSDRKTFERLKELKDSPAITDPLLKRSLEVAWLQYLDNQIDPALNARIVELSTGLEERFNTFRADAGGVKKTDNELTKVLRETKGPDEARTAWEALKQVGPLVAEELLELVELRNEAARQVGFADYYAMQLAVAEQTPEGLKDLLDRVAAMTDAPFRQWKGAIDAELAARFGITVEELRPWHYGDPFFQSAPPVEGLDADGMWNGRDILAVAKSFYAGIGLETEAVLARSDLYEREGKVQHAFCFDIDRGGDVRVLLNLQPTARWAETTLHELGHAVYDVGIDPELPYVLRGAAHQLTTEGVAMMFGGLAASPDWQEAVLGSRPGAELAEKLRQRQVRSWLVFARWALVMTDFERELYADPRQDLGARWWEIVGRHQLLVRPEGRAEPDWATKIHLVTAPVYYHNYLLGELFSAQLREHLAREVLHVDFPAGVVFAGRGDLGPWLREHVFALGKRLRWDEFVEQVTGRRLGPEAFVAQMEP